MDNRRYVQWLYQEIPQWVERQLIPPDAEAKLKAHYGDVPPKDNNRILLGIFSIIGAISVGLGIILLFAYNWDQMPRGLRTLVAFLPLALSWGALYWILHRGISSFGAREGAGVFNILCVAAAIALIGQIYNLPADVPGFFKAWLLLSIPVVYLASSGLAAFFCIIGTMLMASFMPKGNEQAVLFWFMLGAIVPFYAQSIREDRYSYKTAYLSVAMCVALGVRMIQISIYDQYLPMIWTLTASSFFAVIYMIGKFWFDETAETRRKPLVSIGMLGVIVSAYIFTFQHVWAKHDYFFPSTPETGMELLAFLRIFLVAGLVIASVFLAAKAFWEKRHAELNFAVFPVITFLCYAISSAGTDGYLGMWVFNIYLFYLGSSLIYTGITQQLMGLANLGILATGVVILTRFLDPSVGIMPRALIFILLGVCFIAVNVMFSAKAKKEAGHE